MTTNAISSSTNTQNDRPKIQSVNTIAQRIKNEVYNLSTQRNRSGWAVLDDQSLQSHLNALVNWDPNLWTKFTTAGVTISSLGFISTPSDITTVILILAQHEHEEQKLAQKEYDRIYMSNSWSTLDSTPGEIQNQIEESKRSGEWTYYFDSRGFQIKYDSTGWRGWIEKFASFVQKKDGWMRPVTSSTIGGLLQEITSKNEKKEEKNKADAQTVQTGVEMKTDLDPSQIFLALDFVDKNKKKNKGFYSLENKLFWISYSGGNYKVEIQNEDGTISLKDCPDSATTLNTIRTECKKVTEKTEKSLTVDMWKDFDENKFSDLCDSIKKTGKTVGYYTIVWKLYKITLLPANPIANPPILEWFKAEFPGRLDKEEISEVSHASLQNNAQILAHHISEVIHIHDHEEWNNEVSFKDLKDFIKTKVDNHSENHPKEFNVGGKKVKIWKQKWFSMKANSRIPLPSLALYKMRYYAEIPGISRPLSDTTPDGLAKKIINEIHLQENKTITSHAKIEGKEEKEHSDEKWEKKESTPTKDNYEGNGSLYNKAIYKLFWNSIVGKIFKWPPVVSQLLWTAFDSGVAMTIAGGSVWAISTIAGSAAIATFIGPAMATAGIGWGIYSAVKRFKKWRSKKWGTSSEKPSTDGK